MSEAIERAKELVSLMTPEEVAELDDILTLGAPVWAPLPGPQTMAYESEADIIGYGGAAGGGKSDLMCGLALTKHMRSAILRREATQLTGIVDRLEEITGSRAGYNSQKNVWRLGEGRQIDFGSTPNSGDETKYQGRPKDFLGLDEATNFLEAQARFLMGWVRTTETGQKCTVLMTFNPPTSAEGQWVIEFFAPWLVPEHPNPAKPGELRWFATIDGKDVEVESGEPFDHKGETIKPMSRTFIPSKISDNPYLMETGYQATLQSLPEPLRSQMLKGDFSAGLEDDAFQVIPSAWVKAAQDRWEPRHAKGEMHALGCDVARGGRDETINAPRHGTWFDELKVYPGNQSPDGPTVAGYVVKDRRDEAVIHIDMVGWGASPYDFLVSNRVQTVGINGAAKSLARTNDGLLGFKNLRAELYWMMREALDPENPDPLFLPPDPKLRADLCAPKWKVTPQGIQVESKEDIKKRIGRSPDRADAVVMANVETVKRRTIEALNGKHNTTNFDYDPLAEM